MANPQLEDGLTPIAHEIIEAFCRINMSPYEWRIICCILRKTYGFHKKTDRISFSQYETLTGLKHWHISRTLDRLLTRNIITRSGSGYALEYGIQKDYDLWLDSSPLQEKSSPLQVTNFGTSTGDELVPPQVTKADLKSSPLQEKSSPLQVGSVPKQVTNLVPLQVHTKYINIQTKYTTKGKDQQPKESFEDYKEKMRGRYPELDFDNELQKWHEYWYEGNRKCTNPKLALHNWLDIARERLRRNGGDHGQVSGRGDSNQGKRVTARTKEYTEAEYQQGLEGCNSRDFYLRGNSSDAENTGGNSGG